MEGWKVLASINQKWQDLGNFDKAAWPPMREQQRDSILDLTLLVDEVNIIRAKAVNFDLSRVVRQFVELRFCLSPVKAVGPILGQALDVGEGRATGPGLGVRDLIR